MQYRASITIDHTKVSGSGDLTNFPVLVSGTYDGTGGEPDFRSAANGGDVQNVDTSGGNSGALSVPADLAFFSDEALTIQLDHEIEFYDATTGEIAVHVRIPTLDGDANTVIYVGYGNASITDSQENITGVWDSNYVGIWHMNNTPTGLLYDSTSNNNDLTTIGSMGSGALVGGIAGGKAIDFELSSSQGAYITDASQTGLDLTSAFSMIAFVKAESSHSGVIVAKEDDSDGAKRQYNWFLSTLEPHVLGKDASTFDFYREGSAISSGSWVSLGIVANYANASATTYRFFKNSALIGNGTGIILGNIASIQNASEPFTIAFRDQANTPDLYYDGLIDEVRVSNINRSDDWIITEHNSISAPSTFYTMGDAESLEVIGPLPMFRPQINN